MARNLCLAERLHNPVELGVRAPQLTTGNGAVLQPEKYRGGKIIPPDVYNQAVWGLAAGDLNGDGAPELLAGGLDGTLSLLVNETLKDRKEKADEGTINDVRKQIQTRIVTVKPGAAKGVLGSRLTLLDGEGKVVTHRFIGSNIGVGCSGPAQFMLAIREPGTYTLRLRLADGTSCQQVLAIDDKTPRHQAIVIR